MFLRSRSHVKASMVLTRADNLFIHIIKFLMNLHIYQQHIYLKNKPISTVHVLYKNQIIRFRQSNISETYLGTREQYVGTYYSKPEIILEVLPSKQ